jgi:hypothetical protein
MSNRMMREGLAHSHPGMKDEDFFALIDKTGGWPSGYKYVGFEHSDSRAAGFCNLPQNTGWWTVLADADDYFLWKLSPAALQKIADAIISAVRIPKVHAQYLHIKNIMGSRAVLSKEPTDEH